ncbi:MAG: alpha/beta-hydrolase N-terminal domain-containing protein, partial [Actinomycetota bacterium]|nr:alpha/beta-hydrolase N-terminal domain-containing protein [Actinomycetota bacterium]
MSSSTAVPDSPGGAAVPVAETPPRVFSLHFSGPGVVVGLAFFSFSLFASLLPRTGLFQGVVSGITVMIGYGIGVFGQWAWTYLELPTVQGRARRIILGVILAIVGLMTVSAVWRHVGWQNDVRSLFGMDPISPLVWLTILGVAIPVAAVILIIARSIRRLFRSLARWLNRRLPQRLSRLLGGLAVVLLAWLFFTGVLENGFFAAANQIFAPRDTATDEGVEQPDSTFRSGSPQSLAAWDTLGRKGRSFVAAGPTVDDLNAYHGGGAVEPVRVYVGLKSADSIEEQAALVLEEL